MKKNTLKDLALLIAAGFTLAAALSAGAATTVYTLPDIGTYPSYQDFTISDTFAGTGFVGIYTSGPTGPGSSFGHLLGLENYGGIFSETEMEMNISGLSGVTSATLSFNL